VRKEFFKLRNKGHSYNQCRRLILAQHSYEVTTRTLQRWDERLRKTNWNLLDNSRRPKMIHRKITRELESRILTLRNKTGWCAEKIESFVDISHTTINKILVKHRLTKPNPNRKKRIKYIRWQRKHPNSLWQMDTSDQKVEGKYSFAVIDDCSRYCLGLFSLNTISTETIWSCLEEVFKVHGKPREFLSDNGQVFGLKSKHSKFDRRCRMAGIHHIRTAIHSPTTSGKIERFFGTLGKELEFCKGDTELFRMRYNHFRPHSSLNGKPPAEVYFNNKRLF